MKALSTVFGLVLLVFIVWGGYWIASNIWLQFKLLDPKVSVAVLTAATTLLVATLTVTLGKYYERKKDIEAHYRDKKAKIYDEFLSEYFKLFHNDETPTEGENPDLVNFIREWQRKIILWGGQEVLLKYIKWMNHLKKGVPDANSFYYMEEFFIEIRKDLGLKTSKLEKGTFVHLILQNPELFIEMSKTNPNLTLDELAEAEELLKG